MSCLLTTAWTGCPPNSAFGNQQASCDLVQGTCGVFTPSAGTTTITHGVSGAAFKIEEQRDAPTIETPKYIFFGTFEVVIQAAPGAGIVTSAVLQSDDLDEVCRPPSPYFFLSNKKNRC